MLAFALLHLRFCELAAYLLRFHLKPMECNQHFFKQWSCITAQLRTPTGRLKIFLMQEPVWEFRVKLAGRANVGDEHFRKALILWAGEAKRACSARRDQQTAKAKQGFRKWTNDQLRLGAGALHALTKRVEPPIEAAVYIHRAKNSMQNSSLR